RQAEPGRDDRRDRLRRRQGRRPRRGGGAEGRRGGDPCRPGLPQGRAVVLTGDRPGEGHHRTAVQGQGRRARGFGVREEGRRLVLRPGGLGQTRRAVRIGLDRTYAAGRQAVQRGRRVAAGGGRVPGRGQLVHGRRQGDVDQAEPAELRQDGAEGPHVHVVGDHRLGQAGGREAGGREAGAEGAASAGPARTVV